MVSCKHTAHSWSLTMLPWSVVLLFSHCITSSCAIRAQHNSLPCPQERLDFAMKEIILELLSLPKGRGGVVHPERMNIGLRAFLLIADQLERKEAAPPMPNTFGTLPGKFHSKTKSKHLCSTLTEQTVKKIGLNKYLPQ